MSFGAGGTIIIEGQSVYKAYGHTLYSTKGPKANCGKCYLIKTCGEQEGCDCAISSVYTALIMGVDNWTPNSPEVDEYAAHAGAKIFVDAKGKGGGCPPNGFTDTDNKWPFVYKEYFNATIGCN